MTLKNKLLSTSISIIAALSLSSCSESDDSNMAAANAQMAEATTQMAESSATETDYTMASAEGMDGNIPNPCHMYYPNIPGELMLENDKMVVQRYIIEPGMWEGIHRHPYDQLYVHVKGGEWTVKHGDNAVTSQATDGSIGWDATGTTMAELHESGNTGDEPIDLIWITMKPGCLVPN